MSGLLLRGELFKAGDGNSIYKLRWFELLAAGKGELRWSETDGAPGRAISELYGATVTVGLDDFRAGEASYDYTPPFGPYGMTALLFHLPHVEW